MVKSVDENKEHVFEYETRGRNGVNLLGKASDELAEAGFDGFAKVLLHKYLARGTRAEAVLLAGRLLAAAGSFFRQVFPGVIRVAGVGVQDAAFGQVRGQAPQAGLVGFAAGVDVLIDRDAIGGGVATPKAGLPRFYAQNLVG